MKDNKVLKVILIIIAIIAVLAIIGYVGFKIWFNNSIKTVEELPAKVQQLVRENNNKYMGFEFIELPNELRAVVYDYTYFFDYDQYNIAHFIYTFDANGNLISRRQEVHYQSNYAAWYNYRNDKKHLVEGKMSLKGNVITKTYDDLGGMDGKSKEELKNSIREGWSQVIPEITD